MSQGPLAGLKIVEFAGLGPAPFCGMLLSDLGAEVLVLTRPGGVANRGVTHRGRTEAAIDLKQPGATEACLDILASADALVEGFRPGVMERLGLGPEAILSRNPKLVYGRMTGWGQAGPNAHMAGHDINYIALSGCLHAIGPAERPVPPLNLVGDFGGGALYLALGLVSALLHAARTGQGQVVDSAISDGAASLMAMQYGHMASGRWRDEREANRLDGAAPYYSCYTCADGLWIAVGALEPEFYRLFMEGLQIPLDEFPDRENPANWARLRARISSAVKTRTRQQWCDIFDGGDACVSPVLSIEEAPRHPQNRLRDTFIEAEGVTQPAPAPRFSRTPGRIQPSRIGADAAASLLQRWGAPSSAMSAISDLAPPSGSGGR